MQFIHVADENGDGLLLYVREDVPSTLLKTDSEIEAFYVELNVRKKLIKSK